MEERQSGQEFGEYLHRLRLERRIGIRELARRTELDASNLARMEKGERKPRPDTLKTLSSVFDVPLADLFAAAGFITPSDLPSMSTYLRICYSDLPDQAVASIDEYIQRLINEHGLNPNGPAPFEDEDKKPSRE